jgi:hypothetical protein
MLSSLRGAMVTLLKLKFCAPKQSPFCGLMAIEFVLADTINNQWGLLRRTTCGIVQYLYSASQ